MRLLRLSLPLLLLAAATTASAGNHYQRLRAHNPPIDEAVAAMHSASIHGDFTRFAALEANKQVQDYIADPDVINGPPAILDARLAQALTQLTSTLAVELPGLDFRDTMTIAQVVRILATDLAIDVIDPSESVAFECDVTPTSPCTASHPLLRDLVDLVEANIRADYAALVAANPSLPPDLPPPSDVHPGNYAQWLEDILDAPGVAGTGGAESIDDE